MIGRFIAQLRKLRLKTADRELPAPQRLQHNRSATAIAQEHAVVKGRTTHPRPVEMVRRKGSRLPISVGPDFISTAEISALAGMPMREVRRDIALGLMPGAIITAHGWFVPEATVRAYIKGPRRSYSPRRPAREV